MFWRFCKLVNAKKITRRTFFGLSILAADMLLVEPSWLEVTEHDVEVADLPKGLDGYKIVQITDTHLRSFDSIHHSVIKAAVEAKPNLIVLTGDLIEGPDGLPSVTPFLDGLKKTGADVVAILGNWEHWSGVTARTISEIYKKADVRLLVNENLRHKSGLVIAATDDGIGGRPDFQKTFKNLPTGEQPSLFLTHSPYLLDRAPKDESPLFDLSLAGHTHGGQGRVGPFAPYLPPGSGRFKDGFYDTALGRAYVSRGIGTSIVPARFLCRPEMTVFTLKRVTTT